MVSGENSRREKIYAVRVGREPGIYYSWEECHEQVDGYSSNDYKGFFTQEEADAYMALPPRRRPFHRRRRFEPYRTRRERVASPVQAPTIQPIVEKLHDMRLGDIMSITRSAVGFNHQLLPAARPIYSPPNSSGSSPGSSYASSAGSSSFHQATPRNPPPVNSSYIPEDEDNGNGYDFNNISSDKSAAYNEQHEEVDEEIYDDDDDDWNDRDM